MLDALGLAAACPFRPMDPDRFETVHVRGEAPLEVPLGLPAFAAALKDRLPPEADELGRFFRRVGDAFAASEVIFRKGLYLKGLGAMKMGVLLHPWISPRIKARTLRFSQHTLAEVFEHYGLSTRARRLAFGHCGIFAETAEELSFVTYVAATGHYHAGAHYPLRGFEALVRALAGRIEAQGGRVLRGHRVASLEVKGGRVEAAACGNGERFTADLFVSGLAPRLTADLLPDRGSRRFEYQPSNPLTSVYLSLRDSGALVDRLRGRNLWWRDPEVPLDFRRPDMLAPPAMLYVGSNSANSPATAGEGRQSLSAYLPGSWEQATRLSADPGELRQRTVENVLGILAQRFSLPVAGKVVESRVVSPADLGREIDAERGSVYGRRLTPHSVGRRVAGFPHLENLEMASATVGFPGIATGFQTGFLLARRLLGRSPL